MSVPTTPAPPVAVSDFEELFDPFRKPYLEDPYPILSRIRAEQPVFYSHDLGYWVVTRYEDVRAIFRKTAAFSATNSIQPITPPCPAAVDKMAEVGFRPGTFIVNEDAPEGPARRKKIAPSFTPNQLARFEPKIRELVTEYIDCFVRRGEADLVAELTWEIPALVTFALMGVPDEDATTVKQFTSSMLLFLFGRPNEEEQIRMVESLAAFDQYSRMHVRRLIDKPGDDVMSDVIRAHQQDPELFDEEYLYRTMLNLLFAGHETTTNATSNMFQTLLADRALWGAVGQDPSVASKAVEESLRYHSSVIAWRRRSIEDFAVGGVTIPAGSNVLLLTSSANHDPAVFPEPERFDLTRDNANRHLSFGFGAHLCLGAPLARLEMRVFLEEMARRLPHAELVAGQEFEYPANVSFRGPTTLFARWDPAANPVPADRPS
ncbi:MAG: hypothetical protein QOI21_5321 [Actinomycetota bacterium]|jgi:cytochrome P450|nr:hypothetical protein [Actinomycetota bacterium]